MTRKRKRKGNAGMFSQSFKAGFVDGLTAPFTVFAPSTTESDKYVVSVDDAWDKVGGTIAQVLRDENVIVGKKHRATLARRPRPRPRKAKSKSAA